MSPPDKPSLAFNLAQQLRPAPSSATPPEPAIVTVLVPPGASVTVTITSSDPVLRAG
jgi:hypothetical protein